MFERGQRDNQAWFEPTCQDGREEPGGSVSFCYSLQEYGIQVNMYHVSAQGA